LNEKLNATVTTYAETQEKTQQKERLAIQKKRKNNKNSVYNQKKNKANKPRTDYLKN